MLRSFFFGRFFSLTLLHATLTIYFITLLHHKNLLEHYKSNLINYKSSFFPFFLIPLFGCSRASIQKCQTLGGAEIKATKNTFVLSPSKLFSYAKQNCCTHFGRPSYATSSVPNCKSFQIFCRVIIFQVWSNLYSKLLKFMIQNKCHYILH